jgi:ADP-ribose pyrophosphatase
MERVEILSRRRLFDDIFKIDDATIRFERIDGSMSPPVRRLVFERGDSVAAVVFVRDTQTLLLTEQFRFPTHDKGPGWMLEIIAGIVDAGETPEGALRREIEEEMGYRAGHVEPVATFYASPGGSSERIWLYYVETSQADRVSAGGGRAVEHEDIRVVTMSRHEAQAALAHGRFADAKTLIGLQWLFLRPDP